MEVVADQSMHLFIGPRDPTRHLYHLEVRREERERLRVDIAWLFLASGKINARTVYSWRRAGFEAFDPKTKFVQTRAHSPIRPPSAA